MMRIIPKMIKKALIIFSVLQLSVFSLNAQGWETISTPVTTNLILYDISFPAGQDSIGYVGGSNVTFNGKGKILKTTDQGSTWQVIYESDVNGTGVTSIFFLTPDHGYAGLMGGNVMVTTDGGMNWTSSDIDDSVNQGEVGDLEFYDANNGVALTAWGGIYTTTNGGTSWTVATNNYIGGHDLVYADANTLFAVGNDQKIYKSTDGGKNWSQIYSGIFQQINLGVHFADANNGLVTSEEGSVFVTADGGDTWNNYTVAGQFGLMRGAYVFDENNMYATGTPGQVFKTTDGGMNWVSDGGVNPQPSYYKIKFTDNGTGFVCGSGSSGGTILRKLALSVSGVTVNVSCNAGTDGSIMLTVSGGSSPYSYLWSNSDTTQNLSGIPAGNYTCTITDSNGTTVVSDNFVITQPDAIDADAQVTDESEAGANDGAINLTVSGGTPSYEYNWSNGATTQNLQDLSPGEYCVTITDSYACLEVDCFTVMAGPLSNKEIEDLIAFTVSPNPITQNDLLVELQFSSKKDILVSIINSLGQEVYFSEKLNVSSLSTQINTSGFTPGIYFIRITSLKDNKIATKRIVKN